MSAIYKRELKSYFHSFIGLLFIGVTLFFVGLYYTVYNLMYGYPYFSYALAAVIVIFMMTVPILSMRILAEERHSKTDQLILTAPVSVGQIVLGKFLALLTIFAIPTVIICFYPLILSIFGSVPMGEAYLAVLAFFLYGMTCIAIGLFVSSLTESQVIAAVITFAALFVGYMMSGICGLISDTGNLLTTILGCYDLSTPFNNLLNGTLNVASVIYFITLTALALFLTVQSIQKRRYSVSVKHLSLGAYSSGMILASVAIVVVINLFIGQLPSTWTSIDLTSQKLYSLTDQTKEFVKNLEEDITIYVLVSEDEQDTILGQTLARYNDLSDHITVEYVDPTINPRFLSQYTSGSVTVNSLIVESSQRSKVIDYADIYESSIDYYTYTTTTTGYDGEGQITSALDYVTSTDLPKLYFTTGHGEGTLSSAFSAALTKANVEYDTINLMDYDAVPEDAVCLFINGAVNDFSEDDKDKVIDYLDNGGKVITVVGYSEDKLPNYEEILGYMGLTLAEGLVLEGDSNYYYQVPFYLLPDVSYSTYTTGVYGSYYIFTPYAQGLIVPEEDTEEISYNTFLSTTESAYSKVGLENATSYEKAEEDIDGPFAIGVEAEKVLEEGSATMVVYSCSQIFTDSVSQQVAGANLTVFSNTVSAFIDNEVNVSIPSKAYEVSYLTINSARILLIALVTTVILPIGCLVAGFIIWFKRRRA